MYWLGFSWSLYVIPELPWSILFTNNRLVPNQKRNTMGTTLNYLKLVGCLMSVTDRQNTGSSDSRGFVWWTDWSGLLKLGFVQAAKVRRKLKAKVLFLCSLLGSLYVLALKLIWYETVHFFPLLLDELRKLDQHLSNGVLRESNALILGHFFVVILFFAPRLSYCWGKSYVPMIILIK